MPLPLPRPGAQGDRVFAVSDCFFPQIQFGTCETWPAARASLLTLPALFMPLQGCTSPHPACCPADAELVSVAEEHLALMPEHLSFEEAAAIPLVALTAWQAGGPAGGQHGAQAALLPARTRAAVLACNRRQGLWVCSITTHCRIAPVAPPQLPSLQGLENLALPPGGRMLVHGGSSGVGSWPSTGAGT